MYSTKRFDESNATAHKEACLWFRCGSFKPEVITIMAYYRTCKFLTGILRYVCKL